MVPEFPMVVKYKALRSALRPIGICSFLVFVPKISEIIFLIFGVLYQTYGGQVAFTWSAVLAIVAVVLLTLVRGTKPSK